MGFPTLPGIPLVTNLTGSERIQIDTGGATPVETTVEAILMAATIYGPSGVTPVTGSFITTGQSPSFIPLAGRGFDIVIFGSFVGSVQLERFLDGVWSPITAAGVQLYIWSAPASENNEEDQYQVPFRLNCTALASGTIDYSISQ